MQSKVRAVLDEAKTVMRARPRMKKDHSLAVWVPVHLADAVRLYCEVRGRDSLANGEDTAVGNADLASWCLESFLC